jgi:hypothetical protein
MPHFIGKPHEMTEKEAINFAALMGFLGVELDFDLLDLALENGAELPYAEAVRFTHAIVR